MKSQALREISVSVDSSKNILWIGETGYEASPEQLIIKQDEFKSGLECETCGDKDIRNEVSYIPCPECKGAGKRNGKKCSHCDAKKAIPCPACNGKGGSIIIPESAKAAPTTGVVVSAGQNTSLYNLGQRVCFPSFAGHGFNLSGLTKSGKVVAAKIVIIVERDVLCKVHGELFYKNVKKSIALNTNQ